MVGRAKSLVIQIVLPALLAGSCAASEFSDVVVRASIFGWVLEDATECLQKALDSGARRIVIDRQAGDWIVRPLFLNRKSGLEIVLEDGVVVRAKRDEFRDVRDTLLTVSGCSNVVIRGIGRTLLAMNRRDYRDGTRYTTGEWRHALALSGGANIMLSNLTIAESGGDGVYVRGVRNVRMEDVICRENYRQGLSITSVEGFVAKRCKFLLTCGVAPQCGVDIEPNDWRDRISDIVFEDCEFCGNAMAGLSLFLPDRKSESPPFGVTLQNCRAFDNVQCGIWMVLSGKESVKGKLTVLNCSSARNGGSPFYLANAGAKKGLKALVKGCTFDVRESKHGGAAIELVCADGIHDFGDVEFRNCKALVGDNPPVTARVRPGIGLTAVRGVLTVVRNDDESSFDIGEFAKGYPSNPELLKPFRPAKLELGRLRPASDRSSGGANVTTFRWHCSFVQYVPAAGEYPIRFIQKRLTSESSYSWRFQVADATGRKLDDVNLTDPDTSYVLKADRAGIYRFDGSAGHSLLTVVSEFPGQGIVADKRVELFKGRDLRFFFRMPTGARDIEIMLSPQEPGSAQLVDPDGRVVVDVPVQSVSSVIRHRRSDVRNPETWELRFPYIEEDYVFAIGGDAIPVATMGCRENALE